MIKKRNVLLNSGSKFKLIGKINGLSNEVRRARNRILNEKNPASRWKHIYTKASLSSDLRYFSLAYAFLRGVPYKAVERNCSKDNLPKVDFIVSIAASHDPSYAKISTKENVEAWLEGKF